MFSIIDPVITERTQHGAVALRGTNDQRLRDDLTFAAHLEHPVYSWTGENRDGRPIAIIWFAGRRAGKLFTAFEITGR